jgi:hypothetical protein
MTAAEITSLLPPIAVSLGAILPFLVASPPFAVAENAKVLLACLMTLVIWMGYWIAYICGDIFGDWIFFEGQVPLWIIVISAIQFAVVFRAAQRPPEPEMHWEKKDVGDKQIDAQVPTLDKDGKPVVKAAINSPGYLWLYLSALVCVAIAAALYVGTKDHVVVELYPPGDDASNLQKELPVIKREIVSSGSALNAPPVPLRVRQTGSSYTVMLTLAEYNTVEKFHVETVDKLGNNVEYVADRAGAVEELKAGMGKYYRVVYHK